ncbi:hypothetical protein GS429_17530 [Natronorubrum sp. JWXQ-INN-674]|uniref:CARDB domain-containing protein n=1 Tax=Natronorubrum halalkaliphilum TaxID=2691917 RepID=A0A6B0VQB5_9EURY|nr:hypothetical protein [Natronorubrum halalkaliphilum]MXV63830.1 hypothetical protein [Natronorubrum halalkaliphilum]
MTRVHVVRLAVALVLLATVAGAVSVATTTSQFSDSESLEDNQIGAAEWGYTLVVEDDSDDFDTAGNSSNDLEVIATVTNENRGTEAVNVSLEIGNKSETEAMTLERNESDTVTFVLEVDEMDVGEHEYVVTAAEEEIHGKVTVSDGDEEVDDSAEDASEDDALDSGDGNESETDGEIESSDDEAETSGDDKDTDGGDSVEENDKENEGGDPDSEDTDASENDETDD